MIAGAPLLAADTSAERGSQRWTLTLFVHHIVNDNYSDQLLLREIQLLMMGRGHELPAPLPYRNFIARARLSRTPEFEAYFRRQLADIDAPTAPFGVVDVRSNGSGLTESSCFLSEGLTSLIRTAPQQKSARRFYFMWLGHVWPSAHERENVVFGTVLSGRCKA